MAKFSGLAWGLALATSSIALGQEVVREVVSPAPVTEMRRVSQILGSSVRLQGNNNYGKVEDLVLDNNGGISHLVVSNGGQYVMLPWHAADFNYGQRVATYNVTPAAVQPLLFEQKAWPSMADQKYVTRVQQVFPATGVVRRVEGVPAVGEPVVKEKIKVKPNGDVKIKEKVR